jgi:hypothetical protein
VAPEATEKAKDPLCKNLPLLEKTSDELMAALRDVETGADKLKPVAAVLTVAIANGTSPSAALYVIVATPAEVTDAVMPREVNSEELFSVDSILAEAKAKLLSDEVIAMSTPAILIVPGVGVPANVKVCASPAPEPVMVRVVVGVMNTLPDLFSEVTL